MKTAQSFITDLIKLLTLKSKPQNTKGVLATFEKTKGSASKDQGTEINNYLLNVFYLQINSNFKKNFKRRKNN